MYIGDGRKTLKFAVRISASYLLYAMNKLRLSAYLCTPSGIPKLKLWLSLSILHYFSEARRSLARLALKRKCKKRCSNICCTAFYALLL